MTTSTTSSPPTSSPSAFRFCLSGRKRTQSPVAEANQLPTVDAREQRRRAFPQDSSDRDLEYHRFCVSSGRNILSGMAQSALARFVFANDLPVNTHQMITKPEDVQLVRCSEFMIRTTDNELCHCYWLPACGENANRGVGDYSVLYLHGASGNIGHRLEVAKIIQKGIFADVLLIDYRGFGRSSGQPSELGTYLDAQAGLDWILAKHCDRFPVECEGRNGCDYRSQSGLSRRDDRKIVVFGTSLGAAIAMHLASQEDNARHLHAVIVENCFTSIGEISRYYVPNWVRPLLDFVKSTIACPMYDCLGKASRIRCPVLYLVGSRDPVVPAWMSQILYSQTSNSSRKAIREFPEGRHNDLPSSHNYTRAIADFLMEQLEDIIDGHSQAANSTWRSVDDIANNGERAFCGERGDGLGRTTCSMLSLPLKSKKTDNCTSARHIGIKTVDATKDTVSAAQNLENDLCSSIQEIDEEKIRHLDNISELSSSQSRDQTDDISSTSLAGSLTSSSSGTESLKSEDIFAECNGMAKGQLGCDRTDDTTSPLGTNVTDDVTSSIDTDLSIHTPPSKVTDAGHAINPNFKKIHEKIDTLASETSKRSSKVIE